MVADRTSRSNRRVRRRPGTALSNVRPVRRRRRCCTRRPRAVRLWVRRHEISIWRAGSSPVAICRVSISVVVDDVAALVDFQHGLERGVDDVHGVQQRGAEMQFYAQVALLYQMEAGTVALVGGQIETEEGVAVSVVAASQSVPLVLPHLAGRGEQTHVAPDEEVVCKIGLERFGGYLSSVHVHRVEVDGVVLGVKRILVVRTVVGIVIDAAQQ